MPRQLKTEKADLTATGRQSDAEILFRRAQSTCERSLSPKDTCVAAALNNLASVKREQRHSNEAESLCRRALTIQEKALGPECMEVFKTLDNLAETYRLECRYRDAEPIYARSLKIGEQSLGPKHPDVVTMLDNYAWTLRKLHKKTEAKRLEAMVRARRARSDQVNTTVLAIDWRELQQRAK
jgi:tetratricopeptide (TPR) repeat protein